MYLLPAIDILGGKAVRLAKGDYDRVTVYHDDPAAQAQLFEEQGATWLHVVDLDGARSGIPENIAIVERIMRKTLLKVEVGGGVRSLDTIARLADAGVSRVVLGTSLVADPDFAEAAIAQYGKLLCAGIDAKGGEVAVAGWREGAGVAAEELARDMSALGFRHLVYTDIARDGMQTGIEAAAYVRMAEAFGHPVIASGGVAGVGLVFSAMSFYILMLSIFLLLQKNSGKMENLLLLGYAPSRVARPYQLLTLGLNLGVLCVALLAVWLVRLCYLPSLAALQEDYRPVGLGFTVLCGVALALLLSLFNGAAIRRKIDGLNRGRR